MLHVVCFMVYVLKKSIGKCHLCQLIAQLFNCHNIITSVSVIFRNKNYIKFVPCFKLKKRFRGRRDYVLFTEFYKSTFFTIKIRLCL